VEHLFILYIWSIFIKACRRFVNETKHPNRGWKNYDCNWKICN